MPVLRQALCGLACLLLAGCAAVSAPTDPAVPAVPTPGTVLAPPATAPLSPDQQALRLAAARVVLVGETHDHPGHHAIQMDFLRRMVEQGSPLVVGVEWLDASAQPACDALSAGRIDLAQFAEMVDWSASWGYPLELYAPILEYIRERGLPLLALNAPVAVVRQVARQGLASLAADQRARLAPALDLDDPAYREMVASQFAGHGVSGEAAENFFVAQVARDETMAHRLAQALEPWPDSGRRGIVLVGSGHFLHGQGLPPRLARRLPGAGLLTVLPVEPELAAQAGLMSPQRPPSDWLVVSTPAPPRPPRLGVIVKPLDGGLLVERVLPGGAAQRAGIQAGDRLVSVDGRPLASPKDIHDAIKDQATAPHRYLVERGGQRLEIAIALEAAPPAGKAPAAPHPDRRAE
ncbi:MAG: ChaN family lipoprotein [Desulfarculus sp.]|nr:ChaN family lipoprotein [Desulfarculus sp.]